MSKCVYCGAADHRRVELAGGVTAVVCPRVPASTSLVDGFLVDRRPETREVRDALAAARARGRRPGA